MKFKIIVGFIISIACNQLLAQGIKSLTKGQKIIQIQNNTMNMKMEVMGQEMEQKLIMNSTGELNVAASDNDSAKIELRQTKIKMSTTTMGQEVNVDTDKPEDELSKQLSENMKKVVTLSIDKNATIKSIQMDEKTKAIMNSNPATGMTEGQPISFLLLLPSNINNTSAWTDSYGADSNKATYNYTVTSISNDLVTISFTGSINIYTNTQPNGMEVLSKINGPISGTAVVNTKTFFIQKRKTAMDLKGSMSIAGQSIPIEIKSTIEEIYNY